MGRNKKLEEDKKYELTISINEILLKKIDELVEKNGDKRSRFIERLLIEYIEQNKDKLKNHF
jgi:metal-responsive CopG/Arc/MetJ family transcriptional regulator